MPDAQLLEPLRLLLVDDEPLALQRLSAVLGGFDGIEVVGTAGDGDTALAEARRLRPDLIILDVEMPGPSGLSVAAELASEDGGDIIILSAFDRYAAAAFELEALDYLLKPLRPDRLAQAFQCARRRRAERAAHASARTDELGVEPASINVPDRHGGHDVPISQVIWIEAARDYAIIHTRTRSHILRITMNEFAASLPESIIRVHRSAFVNASEARRWGTPAKGVYSLILSDGTMVGVGPSYVVGVRGLLRYLPS
jgi:DNA-binding LytR/AlgR family response regulator